MVLDNAGNTLATARKITLTSTTQTITDSVGGGDLNDFYSFSLSSRSSFRLTLGGLSQNANVELIRDSNLNGIVESSEIISRSYNDGTATELIGGTLDVGNYFIRVFPSYKSASSKATSYSLGVSAQTLLVSNTAPTSLAFNLDNPTVTNTGTLNISRGQVFDLDGVRDISVVDFQIFRNGSLVNSVSSDLFGTSIVVNPSDNRWGSFNYSLNLTGLNLTSGSYTLRAVAYDKAKMASNLVEKGFTISSDWFSQYLKDQQVVTIARSLASDGNLSRNDMISILRDTRDGGVVDTTEVTDLKTLIANASRFTMQNHVRVLSNKVVNGDVANTKSGIGNLFAGSNATQLDRLLGKWFLGSERPQTTYQYEYANGSLFKDGISYQDIYQGAIGDCYFLAGLAATASRTPNVIQSMFIDNGDNTFTVRFYNKGVADYVTVDRYLPKTEWGSFVFANQGGSTWGYLNDPANELWVALAEKAYAQLNESGWINQDGTNSYMGIDTGWEGDAMNHITGRSATFTNTFTMDTIVKALNAGQLVALGTQVTDVATNLLPNHAYTVIGYNSLTQKLILFNPWGVNNSSSQPGILELSWSEIDSNFDYVTHTV